MSGLSAPPLRVGAVFVDKVWAGGRMPTWHSDAGPACGEVWLVSGVAGSASALLDHQGRATETTLDEAVGADPGHFLGERELAAQRAAGLEPHWPSLIKVLDMGPPLSVQLHPDGAIARALGDGERGKCEAWLVLERGPGARVHAGVVPADDERAQLEALLADCAASRLSEDALASFVPEVGEGLAITPGTLHTAQDLLVLEVQETSDVTYRVYDWGRGRELHLEQARRTLETLGLRPPPPRSGGWRFGARDLSPGCPFRFDAVQLDAGESWEGPAAGPRVLVGLRNRVEVSTRDTTLPLSRGEALLIPDASGPVRVEASAEARFACASPRGAL